MFIFNVMRNKKMMRLRLVILLKIGIDVGGKIVVEYG